MRPWSRRALLTGAGALIAGCPTASTDGERPRPAHTGTTGLPLPEHPHIVYVFVDQLRWDAVGALGQAMRVTPVLDLFAEEAVAFRRCVTNAPSCRPARTTMMTGLHVFEHGVSGGSTDPDPALGSHVARIRDEAGYHTAVVGKTDLHREPGHLADHADRLAAWGFDESVELPDPPRWDVQSVHSDHLTATTPTGETDKYQRWQDYILRYTWDAPPPDEPPWELGAWDHLDTFCAERAAELVRTYTNDRPLYLQACFPGPRSPFDAPRVFVDAFDPYDPRLKLPILTAPQPPIAPFVSQTLARQGEPWAEGSARRLLSRYYAKINLVDHGIGVLFDALREAGMWDDAWVIVHADHGELATDHLMTGRIAAYEGSIRVPLLIKPPRGVAGTVVDDLVDQRDVTATLLAAAGLDPAGMGDRDLGPDVLAGRGPGDKIVMFENLGMVGLREDQRKLTWDLAQGLPTELYLLDEDPGELVNRIHDPALQGEVARLVGELRSRRPLEVDEWTG
ncbi:MAG: sulfatase-like hydrolase/transferase [Myxococcales bacterium]|nr:sulfatase-like hydrolase/transferase [Myxococcales bacterium]